MAGAFVGRSVVRSESRPGFPRLIMRLTRRSLGRKSPPIEPRSEQHPSRRRPVPSPSRAIVGTDARLDRPALDRAGDAARRSLLRPPPCRGLMNA